MREVFDVLALPVSIITAAVVLSGAIHDFTSQLRRFVDVIGGGLRIRMMEAPPPTRAVSSSYLSYHPSPFRTNYDNGITEVISPEPEPEPEPEIVFTDRKTRVQNVDEILAYGEKFGETRRFYARCPSIGWTFEVSADDARRPSVTCPWHPEREQDVAHEGWCATPYGFGLNLDGSGSAPSPDRKTE